MEVALKQPQRQRILEQPLNRPLERTRPIGRIPARIADRLLRLVGELDLQVASSQPLTEPLELQLDDVLQLMARLRDGEAHEISAAPQAAQALEAARIEAAKKSIWATGCKSWYLDKNGVPASWPWTYGRFVEEMAAPQWEAFEQR